MAFCMNCGCALPDGSKFCPGCGTRVDGADDVQAVSAYTTTVPVSTTVSPVFSTSGISDVTGYNVVLVSTGSCDTSYADDLISDLLGYSITQSQALVSNVPALVAQSLSRKQAMYVVQALAEYGMDAAAYDSHGYVDFDSEATSTIFKKDGSILAKVAAVLGTITLANRVNRLIRWNTPFCLERFFRPKYFWTKPPHIKQRFEEVPRIQRPIPGSVPPPPAPEIPAKPPRKKAPELAPHGRPGGIAGAHTGPEKKHDPHIKPNSRHDSYGKPDSRPGSFGKPGGRPASDAGPKKGANPRNTGHGPSGGFAGGHGSGSGHGSFGAHGGGRGPRG